MFINKKLAPLKKHKKINLRVIFLKISTYPLEKKNSIKSGMTANAFLNTVS